MTRLVFQYGFIVMTCGFVIACAVAGVFWLKSNRIEIELRDTKAQLATCGSRVTNLIEDKESDAKVNDPGDFDIPSEWMLP